MKSKAHIFKISSRILKRDKKKLILSFFSLFIGAFVLTVVLGIIGGVRSYLQTESKSLIGGDIVIQKAFPVDYNKSETIKDLINNGAEYAERMDTMVSFISRDKERVVLSSLKVVSENYPLYGKLETMKGISKIPDKFSIYVESSFLERLDIKRGAKVFIGEVPYIAEDVIISEPDSFGSGFSFGPRVLISKEGWERAKIDKDSSRISYFFSLKYPDNSDNKLLDQKISGELKESGTNITTAEQGPERLMRMLDASQRFFLTVTVLTLFLIMVNIRSNLVYLLDYFTKTIAVFRAMGMRRESILTIFILILTITASGSGALGNISGNSVSLILKPYIEEFISAKIPGMGLFDNFWAIIIFTLLLCLLSASSTLLRAMDIEPKMVLSRDFKSENKRRAFIRESLALLFISGGLFLAVYYLTKNIRISFISILSLTIIFLIFLLLIKTLIFVLYKNKYHLSFISRSIINFIKNQGIVGETAIASLSLALSCIFTISLIQHNIEKNLQGQLKEDIPNVYVIDVQEKQKDYVQAIFKDKLTLYPNVRARLISIDNQKVQSPEYLKEHPELRRAFNLTYRTELIEGEKLYSGEWHGNKLKNTVSLEKKFAERAGISLGSELELSIQGVPVKAKVSSFRTVEESRGLPFFFLVFSPDVIGDAPKSYFGYAYIEEKEIPGVQNNMALLFPNVATIPTNDVVETIRNITSLILSSIFAVALPALILGIILIFSMLANSARERFRDLLLFKTFGAGKNKIFKLYLLESASFIIIATSFSSLISFIASYYVIKEFFKFDSFYYNPQVIYLSVISLVFSLLFSLYLIRKMFSLPPAVLFRSEA